MTRYFTAAAVLVFSLSICVRSVYASGPTVGLPVASPSAFTAGASTVVRVSSLINSGTGPALIANSVNLLQVDATGRSTAIMGALNDSGQNGDLRAGDQIFSGQFTLNFPTPGPLRLQVSAAFTGQLRRVLSDIANIEVLPIGFPVGPAALPIRTVSDVNGNPMTCDQVMVYVRPGTDYSAINNLITGVGGRVVGFLSGRLNTWQVQIACGSAADIQNTINQLLASSLVVAAEPNSVAQTLSVIPNDPLFRDATPFDTKTVKPMLQQIKADKAWAITTGLSPTFNGIPGYVAPVIGIVDSGVDYNHEDISSLGKVIKGKNFVAGTNDPMDNNGHGTAVAGVAAADGNNAIGMPGVSWASRIVAEKAANEIGQATEDHIAQAIDDAMANGAKIINLSLGGKRLDLDEAQAIGRANSAGVLVVAGAGNDFCSEVRFPAGMPHQMTFDGTLTNTRVLSVGGIDPHDQVDFIQGDGIHCGDNDGGSDFGPKVDIYAPWDTVSLAASQCTECSTGVKYDFFGGTSFSTPYVSGAAALVWAANPQLTATEVMNLLLATARQGSNDPLGHPIAILDVFSAVFRSAAMTCKTCPQAPEVSIGSFFLNDNPMVTVGVGSRGATDGQSRSMHGVSLPLTPVWGGCPTCLANIPVAYQIDLLYSFNTWDSYTTGAYYDSFSISTSWTPYWQVGLQSPLSLFSLSPRFEPFIHSPGQPHCEVIGVIPFSTPECPFDVALIFGGQQNRGNALLNLDSSLAGVQIEVPTAYYWANDPQFNTWLNFILDTATPMNSDNRYPSNGVFVINDITPLCLDYQDLSKPPALGICKAAQ